MKLYDVVVIGGGPAGLAAALEAKRNGIDNVLILERDKELGGILQQCIHNGFGLHEFKEEMTGPEYAERFIDEIKNNHIDYKVDTMVMEITQEKGKDRHIIDYINVKEGFTSIRAISVILAMGCRERTRGALSIPGSRPSGIWSAGTAQRYMNIEGFEIGKRIFILGSGDIGLIMARRMTLEGAKVLGVAELMPFAGGLNRNIVQCLNDFDIPLLLSHTVTNIIGKDRLEGIELSQVDENLNVIEGTQQMIECDTLLLSVGLIPENELSKRLGIQIDQSTKGLKVNSEMATSISGIYGCGNVVHVHDLVDFVSKESRQAGKFCSQYVKKIKSQEKEAKKIVSIDTQSGKGISYVVPQSITLKNDNITINPVVELFFRVQRKYSGVKVVGMMNNERVFEKKLAYGLPGEMIKVNVCREQLIHSKNATLEICIESE